MELMVDTMVPLCIPPPAPLRNHRRPMGDLPWLSYLQGGAVGVFTALAAGAVWVYRRLMQDGQQVADKRVTGLIADMAALREHMRECDEMHAAELAAVRGHLIACREESAELLSQVGRLQVQMAALQVEVAVLEGLPPADGA